MIYNIDTRPKSITLVRLSSAGGAFLAPTNPADFVPLLQAGAGDARSFRPDLTTSQTWEERATVHESPLAVGALAANHRQIEPGSVSFDCLITDTPLLPFGALGGLPGVRRADALLAALMEMYRSGDFIAVISPTRVFESALITAMTTPRTAADGSAYQVTIEVRESTTYELTILPSIDDVAGQFGASLPTAGGVVVGAG